MASLRKVSAGSSSNSAVWSNTDLEDLECLRDEGNNAEETNDEKVNIF